MTRWDDRRSEAVEMFLQGRYFEAEKVFEDLWHKAGEGEKEQFRGWALLAASLFHRDRGNAKGARSCFQKAAAHWQRVPEAAAELSLGDVLEAVEAVLDKEWQAPLWSAEAEEQDAEPERWEESGDEGA